MIFAKKRNVFLRSTLLMVLAVFAVVILNSTAVFADDPSIAITANSLLEMEVEPYTFTTAENTVQVMTNSPYGYSLMMQTVGDSTDMVNDNDNTLRIPTITGELLGTQINNGYGYSLDGVVYRPVPSIGGNGALIFDTNVTTPNIPVTHVVEFGAKINEDVTPGVYENTFMFTAIVNDPILCDAETICYVENGVVVGGTLDDQSAPSNTSVTLMAPNFYKVGYGFAGWNTSIDGTGTNYGPNELVPVGDLSISGLILYAKWIPSSGLMQNFAGCDSLNKGESIALTDSRDGNVYTVTRQEDGACWMTENLRLDFSNPDVVISAQNTNNPTSAFIDAVNAHPASSNQFCTNDNRTCVNQVLYNHDNIMTDQADSWYSYGNYYNWYTATAGNGTYAMNNTNVRAAGDICPAGWRLPTGAGRDGDFAVLDIALGGTGNNNQASVVASNRWRKYPVNFILGGQFNGTSMTDGGVSGNYVSSVPLNAARFTNLWLLADKVSMNSNGSVKTRGQSVRCIIKEEYTIHYDSNLSVPVSGTMDDQRVTRGNTANLNTNTFAHTYSNHVWYQFVGWNTAADGSGDSYADGQEVMNLAPGGQTITLYAQWETINYVDVVVRFDQNAVSRVSFDSSIYGDQAAFFDEDVVPLAIGKTYNISFWLNAGYEFSNWSTSEDGTLGSTTDANTTYVVTDEATITLAVEEGGSQIFIQNLDPTLCTATPLEVYDIRDNQSYYIQRLVDGKCWMIDDLKLGYRPNISSLTPNNTNIAADSTFIPPTTSTAVDSYTTPQINTLHTDEDAVSYGNTSGKAGVLYNFCAASAGTVCSDNSPQTPTYDICPAGWTLPTGGPGNSDFMTLSGFYNSVPKLREGASLTFTGWYDNAKAHGVTEYGTASYLWSKTPSNATDKTYVMFVGRTKKSLDVGYTESSGMAVRCVLK